MTTLFGHSIRSELLVLYVIEGLACFLAIYCVLLWGAPLDPLSGLGPAALLAVAAGLVSGASGLYRPAIWSRFSRLLRGSLVAGLLLLLLAWPLLHLFRATGPAAGPGWLARLVLACLLVIIATRLGFAAAARGGLLKRRLALVRDEAAPRLPEVPETEFETAFTVRPGQALAAELAPGRLRAGRVWAVVAQDPAVLPPAVRHRCEAAGVHVFSAAELRERHLARLDIDRLPEGWAATTRAAREGRAEAALRRGLDIAIALFLLIFTLPVLVLTALAVKLDSPGPVFYRQERVGRGGRVFRLLKFRSMVTDAEAGGAPVWASKQDPRVTRVGRFIRLTRLDEVPQVLNVLRGDMALVGPRPERPAFVAQLAELIPHYADRALVRPGITGWAQVNYPYGASVEDARMKLAYDLYYLGRRSLFLDLLILVATVRVVLFQEGSR
ncbi:exopolysaccharide biosynthesis polyprenyl glycosylphosphotransferase [Siccirubricoccus sp. KC 17139]|uniref:Exopolysaccharide biosynthesis polyprenyl glycosylphosphotransferase n=1 Tax=Siccirubricoccus soli TaxID=2899147 RepID=A0ABT1DE37_9PROT|nr:exopolysaccharide biosynthesis polyprenyl glycosylphosphotransferase [Siccirubricoccus soli]MCO6419882.1 exopolysaccharide biosynthesis polyprenyl glycosylphosphotransferase [Siccirubricoccus soli]MCP2686017.1 exopolysaccharide biosynthesis polyprenyl glycosylphosphotransferase [Siccirubricoccus soli]